MLNGRTHSKLVLRQELRGMLRRNELCTRVVHGGDSFVVPGVQQGRPHGLQRADDLGDVVVVRLLGLRRRRGRLARLCRKLALEAASNSHHVKGVQPLVAGLDPAGVVQAPMRLLFVGDIADLVPQGISLDHDVQRRQGQVDDTLVSKVSKELLQPIVLNESVRRWRDDIRVRVLHLRETGVVSGIVQLSVLSVQSSNGFFGCFSLRSCDGCHGQACCENRSSHVVDVGA